MPEKSGWSTVSRDVQPAASASIAALKTIVRTGTGPPGTATTLHFCVERPDRQRRSNEPLGPATAVRETLWTVELVDFADGETDRKITFVAARIFRRFAVVVHELPHRDDVRANPLVEPAVVGEILHRHG